MDIGTMFKKVILKNFMSFRDIEINLCTKSGSPPNYALFYGENGAGKSNMIQSVSFLKESVTTLKAKRLFSNELATIPEIAIPSLSDIVSAVKTIGSNENTYVCYDMVIKGKNTVYEMEFSGDKLVREELHTSLGKKSGLLFSIVDTGTNQKIYFAEKMIKDPSFEAEMKKQISRYWGKNSFLAIMDLQTVDTNLKFIQENTFAITDIIEYLESIQVSVLPFFGQFRLNSYPFLSNLEIGVIHKKDEQALRFYEKALNRFFRRMYHNVTGVRYELVPSGDTMEYKLLFDRKIDGQVITVPSVRESNGTRKLVSIFTTLMSCASGGVAFIDEMDSGVHDKLICDLLMQSLPEVEGQLVITTHNTELLKHVPAKNVFVIDVDSDGYKEVRNFNKVVRTQTHNNNQSRYMNNAVGGIPYIGIIDLKGIAEELAGGLKADV